MDQAVFGEACARAPGVHFAVGSDASEGWFIRTIFHIMDRL